MLIPCNPRAVVCTWSWGVTFLPWGALWRLPAGPLSSYPPAVGPQAACSPHPCLTVCSRVLRGAPRVETDGRPSSVCRLCRKQETGGPLALPCPSLIPSLTGPAVRRFHRSPVVGAGPLPLVESPGEQGGSWGDPGTEQREGT